MPFFVQFPHPGREHRPSPPSVDTVMDWNVGKHKRKFLHVNGAYISDGHRRDGAFSFWGEWEAPSRVLSVWPKKGEQPQFLHAPVYQAPTAPYFQNTDPLVFGDRFLYTNCKQLNNGKLRRLTPSSIVLFGSGKKGRGLLLDTVFVVDNNLRRAYKLGEIGVVPESPAADLVVFQALATTRHVGRSCVAYTGRMYHDGGDKPYSFVPCLPESDDSRFARPLLEPIGPLNGLINPRSTRAARVQEMSEEQLAIIWQYVVDVCRRHGLAQGVLARPPDTNGAAARVPGHEADTVAADCTRRGC